MSNDMGPAAASEEATGDGWYVDARCTNCDVARQLAPDVIREQDGRAEVIRQPRNEAEQQQLYAAAFACHTRSIRHPAHRLTPTSTPSRSPSTTPSISAATTPLTRQERTPTCCVAPTAAR